MRGQPCADFPNQPLLRTLNPLSRTVVLLGLGVLVCLGFLAEMVGTAMADVPSPAELAADNRPVITPRADDPRKRRAALAPKMKHRPKGWSVDRTKSAPRKLRFFVVADNPYSADEVDALDDLLWEAESLRPDFLAHLGDIKSGISLCAQSYYQRIAAVFAGRTRPLVYSPGDNEWADCARWPSGGHEPRNRLHLLRELFFRDPVTLRLDMLEPVWVDESHYPEIFVFTLGQVLFVNLHVVGSDDNGTEPDEQAARFAINRKTLALARDLGWERGVRAAVVFYHANIRLEPEIPSGVYAPLVRELQSFVEGFVCPVLMIHGDWHAQQLDHPWEFATSPARSNMLRLQVPGTPDMTGVMVTVEPGADEVFRFLRVPEIESIYPE